MEALYLVAVALQLGQQLVHEHQFAGRLDHGLGGQLVTLQVLVGFFFLELGDDLVLGA